MSTNTANRILLCRLGSVFLFYQTIAILPCSATQLPGSQSPLKPSQNSDDDSIQSETTSSASTLWDTEDLFDVAEKVNEINHNIKNLGNLSMTCSDDSFLTPNSNTSLNPTNSENLEREEVDLALKDLEEALAGAKPFKRFKSEDEKKEKVQNYLSCLFNLIWNSEDPSRAEAPADSQDICIEAGKACVPKIRCSIQKDLPGVRRRGAKFVDFNDVELGAGSVKKVHLSFMYNYDHSIKGSLISAPSRPHWLIKKTLAKMTLSQNYSEEISNVREVSKIFPFLKPFRVDPLTEVRQASGSFYQQYAGRSLDVILKKQLADKNSNPKWEARTAFEKVGKSILQELSLLHDEIHHGVGGVVHRDLKPGNIMIHNGAAHLTDFGQMTPEKLNEKVRWAGTIRYASPNSFGGNVQFKDDIWSLGMTLWEMTHPHWKQCHSKKAFNEEEKQTAHFKHPFAMGFAMSGIKNYDDLCQACSICREDLSENNSYEKLIYDEMLNPDVTKRKSAGELLTALEKLKVLDLTGQTTLPIPNPSQVVKKPPSSGRSEIPITKRVSPQ